MSDSTVTPTRRREATRQRLLDAAALVFAEVGLDAASVEAVCERAGFTRGAFYSNFSSKEELFLQLCARTAEAQIAEVRGRIDDLERSGAFGGSPRGALDLVHEVLEGTGDTRLGVLLISEIRLHALRTPALAEAWLAQEARMRDSVAQIVTDIVRANGLRLRTTPEIATRVLLSAWSFATEQAAMVGLDPADARERLSAALAEIAELVIEVDE